MTDILNEQGGGSSTAGSIRGIEKTPVAAVTAATSASALVEDSATGEAPTEATSIQSDAAAREMRGEYPFIF